MEDYGRVELFRYGIISPLIQKFLHEEKVGKEDFEELSKKVYYFKGKNYQFSPETIRKWYYHYKKVGLESLKNKGRKDKEDSRALSDDIKKSLIELRSKYPKMTTKNMYKKLIEEGYIKESKVNIRSFYRYLSSSKLKRSIINNVERKRYEVEHPNDVWQGDTSYGPYITIEGKKYRVFIIHFIDDCSRLIVGYGFYLNDNGINVQKTLKKAIKTYGIPKKIYLDNGKPYKNEQLAIICARLGIKLSHTKPYDPESKGKVERSFKTIKEGWMYARDWNQFHSLEDLEKDYEEYLFENYINSIHSELEDTPNHVWHNEIGKTIFRSIEEEKLSEDFLHEVKRKVAKDGTITIENKLYEVPRIYVGETITLRYSFDDLNKMWIYENDIRKEEVNLLDKKANSQVKRNNLVDYSKIVNNEEDVIELESEEHEIS